MLNNGDILRIAENVNIIKSYLVKIMTIADDKDDEVESLVRHYYADIDTIIKCAEKKRG